jgi:hypothetical protein
MGSSAVFWKVGWGLPINFPEHILLMSEEHSSFVAPVVLLERVHNISQIYKETVKLFLLVIL